jgi:aconitate hydratase
MAVQDYFGAKDTFETGSGPATIYRLSALEQAGITQINRLPYSIRILLEAALRQADGFEITRESIETIAKWGPESAGKVEIPFKPARVVLQDFTGVPSVVDLAALRNAMQRLGGDPRKVNPMVPVDLVIDPGAVVQRRARI